MSKRKLESLVLKMERKSKRQRDKERKEAELQAASEQKLSSRITSTTAAGVKVAAGLKGAAVVKATGAVVAKGGVAAAAKVLAGTAVAAPPFSTVAAVVGGIGLAAFVGIKAAKGDRDKWLKGDKKTLNKLISKYKKKSSKWRKKRIAKLLRQYEKHLSKGNKRTLSLIDGDKRNKEEANWRAKKAKLELKMKALYAIQYKKSYKKLVKDIKTKKKPKRPKITKRQAVAEKRVVKRIKRKQANSIDPRTSAFPLLSPGVIGITPKLATADALQGRVSDTGIIKLARMNPSPSAFKQISQSHDQAVALMKAPEKDLPKELQQPKKDNKAVIIGVSAVSALLVMGGAVVLARK